MTQRLGRSDLMMMRWCNQKEEQQTVELIINYFLRVWMQNHSSVMETTVVHLGEICFLLNSCLTNPTSNPNPPGRYLYSAVNWRFSSSPILEIIQNGKKKPVKWISYNLGKDETISRSRRSRHRSSRHSCTSNQCRRATKIIIKGKWISLWVSYSSLVF